MTQNHKIKNTLTKKHKVFGITLFIFVLLGSMLSFSRLASAADIALCIVGANSQQMDITNSVALKTCTDAGGKVVKPGEVLPIDVCTTDRNVGVTTLADCQAISGNFITAGNTLPSIQAPAVVPPLSFTNTGSSSNPAQFDTCNDIENCSIVEKFIDPAIKVLSAMIGVIVTIMLIVAGIQYSSAGSDPQKVAAAKGKVANAVIALLTLLFLYGLIQWLWIGEIN